jgi:hypothetical protein
VEWSPRRLLNAVLFEVERVVLNALAEGTVALPPNMCVFGDSIWHRLRRSRSTFAWKKRLTQTPCNNRTVAGIAEPGREVSSRLQNFRGQRRAGTNIVRSVVLGQKSEILHNLLPNFMQYVSEQFETAPRDS